MKTPSARQQEQVEEAFPESIERTSICSWLLIFIRHLNDKDALAQLPREIALASSQTSFCAFPRCIILESPR